MLLAGVVVHGTATLAEELMCGDGDIDAIEQCDDGNSTSGDGCSAACSVEQCGNRVVDSAEQCDDGNATNGDGCSSTCVLEFCGNAIVDRSRGEQCDDGNNIHGDGCSADCGREPGLAATPIEDSVETSTSFEVSKPLRPAAPPMRRDTSLIDAAASSLASLASSDAEEIITLLGDTHATAIRSILQSLMAGKILTHEQRSSAATIALALSQVRESLRTSTLDLLRSFISSPISSSWLPEARLSIGTLTQPDIGVLLQTLTTTHPDGGVDAPAAVTSIVDTLRDAGLSYSIDITKRPMENFRAIAELKASVEKEVSDDPRLSLSIVRQETEDLRTMLPALRAQGIDTETIEAGIEQVAEASFGTKTPDGRTLVRAAKALSDALEHATLIDPLTSQQGDLHAAAQSDRILQNLSVVHGDVSPLEAPGLLKDLAAQAPEELKHVFISGSTDEQKDAIATLLSRHERAEELRAVLRQHGDLTFDERYDQLQVAIDNAGRGESTKTPCDDSIAAALSCSNTFFADLESAARNRTVFTRLINHLQDSFGISE